MPSDPARRAAVIFKRGLFPARNQAAQCLVGRPEPGFIYDHQLDRRVILLHAGQLGLALGVHVAFDLVIGQAAGLLGNFEVWQVRADTTADPVEPEGFRLVLPLLNLAFILEPLQVSGKVGRPLGAQVNPSPADLAPALARLTGRLHASPQRRLKISTKKNPAAYGIASAILAASATQARHTAISAYCIAASACADRDGRFP